jgi:holliday junction DNA helicase RuvB
LRPGQHRALLASMARSKSTSRTREPAEAQATDEPPRAAGERLVGAQPRDDEDTFDRLFRPTTLEEYVGQDKHKENLRVFVEAAKRRAEPLDHVLLCGPPGLGKTTLAIILAREMGVAIHTTSGPAIEHKGALAGLLTSLQDRDVLFIDEIHRLGATVEESLYPAIESYAIDVMMGEGPHASTIHLSLRPFSLVGATTRTGLLTAPLLSRFGYVMRLDFYPVEDLVKIVRRSARLLKVRVDDDGAYEIAHRSRGTPRVANRLLRRVSDFALVLGDGSINRDVASRSCERLEIDSAGLDEMDRRLLRIIIETYQGGPVGVETLAAGLAEPRDTVEDVYEPYLLQQGYLGRTPRGRIATHKAYEHLGIALPSRPPPNGQAALF